MALLFMDSCEHLAYGQQSRKWDWAVSPGCSTTNGRTGGYYSNGYCAKFVAASGSTAIVGFATKDGAMSVGVATAAGTDQTQVYLAISTQGSIQIKNAGGTTLAESAAGVFRSGSWNYIEWKTLIDNSAGTTLVKCNGDTVINATGLDTQSKSDATWAWVRFNFPGGTLDDVYICDTSGSVNNDLLGECRVICLLPQDGNGSNSDFDTSAGGSPEDHGAMVNEQQINDDTDYVYSSTLNHVDTWNYPAVGYTGTIKGVQMSLGAMKTDSGTRAIAAVTRPASTNRVHATNHYLSTGYMYWLALWELNPEDSAAWEVADVDGAEFGVKVTV